MPDDSRPPSAPDTGATPNDSTPPRIAASGVMQG